MSRGRRPPQGLGKEGGEGWGQPSDSQRNRGGGQGEAPEASTSWQVPWPGVLASSPAVGQQLRRGGPLGLSSGGCCGIEGTVLSPCLRRCPPPCLLCPLTRVPQGCSWGSWRCLRRLSLRGWTAGPDAGSMSPPGAGLVAWALCPPTLGCQVPASAGAEQDRPGLPCPGGGDCRGEYTVPSVAARWMRSLERVPRVTGQRTPNPEGGFSGPGPQV